VSFFDQGPWWVGLAAAFLVVWWKPALLGKAAIPPQKRAGRPNPSGGDHAGLLPTRVARAAPAVVNIYTARLVTERTQAPTLKPIVRRFFGRAIGSVSSAAWGPASSSTRPGTIVTNQHVIAGG